MAQKDVQGKIKFLEDQFISTNLKILELSQRVAKVEELLTKHLITNSAALNQHRVQGLSSPGDLYERLSSIACDFNSILPDLADALVLNNVSSDDKIKSDAHASLEFSSAPAQLQTPTTVDKATKSCTIFTDLTASSAESKTVQASASKGNASAGKVQKSESLQSQSPSNQEGSKKELKQEVALDIKLYSKPFPSHDNEISGEKKKQGSDTKRDLKTQEIQIKVQPTVSNSSGDNKATRTLPVIDTLKRSFPVVENEKQEAKASSELKVNSQPKIFEENPWGNDLDDIPWEGTDNIDPTLERELKDKGIADPLSFIKKEKEKTVVQCAKKCTTTTGHNCGVLHDQSNPCPPCMFLVKNFKLKCNHRIDILCHRQSKISDVCSECDAKRLVKIEQSKPVAPRPALSLTMDPIQSESELAFKRVREILNKITASNFEKLSADFIEIVNAQTKFLPEIASVLIEKAMLDVENPLSPANYAKIASKTINRPEGELKMFRIEVVTLVVTIFSTVLKLPGAIDPPFFVKNLLKRKEISELDTKRRNLGVLRFVGELYNHDVISLTNLQKDVIDALLGQPTEENLDYVCKLLTLVGHKINLEVVGTPESLWLDEVFAKLNPSRENATISPSVRFSIENLFDLKEAGWDRFKKSAGQTSTMQSVVHTGSTNSLNNGHVTGSTSSNNMAPPKAKKSRTRKKKAPALPKEEMQRFPEPIQPPVVLNSADIFDPWESAPWGEHTDPLAVAFPRLDSPGLLSLDFSGSELGWKGSQSSISFAKPMSSASSRLISPAVSTSSINSSKAGLPPPVNAVGIFQMYLSIHTHPQANRIALLKKKLGGCEEKQIRDFVRNLSRHITKLTKRVQFAALGLMIDVLIKSKLASDELVLKGFQSGIVSDLPFLLKSKPKEYKNTVEAVALVVVTIWSERMTNFSWLTVMGKNLHATYPEAWNVFCSEVMQILIDRKKIKFVQTCYAQTPEGLEALIKPAKALRVI